MSTSARDWQAFRRAGDAGNANVRLMAYMTGDRAAADGCQRPTRWLYGDRLRPVGVKLFADGALGSRGAWLKQPYADKPDTRGLQFHSDAEMLAQADAAASRGFQIATHAIGDAANARSSPPTSGCQANTAATGAGGSSISRSSIRPTFRALAPAGIIASMQPTHQTSDRLMAEKRLGPNRLAGRLCLAVGAEERREAWRSAPISRWNRPIPSPAWRRRSAGRT